MSEIEFSYKTREKILVELNEKKIDTLIIGGGIVGTGLARELSYRGVDTLLLEQNDFASGTSSKSSKLIHGGLRYLEMFEFHLVFEALKERTWLLKNHPHLVKPIEFNLPIYKKNFKPKGMRPTWMLKTGLWLYDLLTLGRTPFFHGSHTLDEVKKKFPGLNLNGLKQTLYYADALMLDDELVLECAYSAVQNEAKILNYVKVLKIESKIKEGSLKGYYPVFCCDNNPKSSQQTSKKEFLVYAKNVVSCVGPWTDIFSQNVVGSTPIHLKPSLGTHLVFDWKKCPMDECLVLFEEDGRIVFVIPRKDLGKGKEKAIVGTTDTKFSGDPQNATPPKEDIDYLLSILSKYLPSLKLKEEDILVSYAGIRPLVFEENKVESTTSREHKIWKNSEGIVFVAGGKYTTFRVISQEVADFVHPSTRAHRTRDEDILSSKDEYEKRNTGAPFWGRFNEGFLNWKIRHHCPITLEDVIYRRIPIWLDGKNIEPKILKKIEECLNF